MLFVGQLALARIAGPHGRVVWNRVLPLTSLLLYGGWFQPKRGAFESRDNDAVTHLVAIDLASGRVSKLDFSGATHDFPHQPLRPSGTRLHRLPEGR